MITGVAKLMRKVDSAYLAFSRRELGRRTHRAQDVINDIIRVDLGWLRVSTDNWALGETGGSFRPVPTVSPVPAPRGQSIDRLMLTWKPGDPISARSLLDYAHWIVTDQTYPKTAAILRAEGTF